MKSLSILDDPSSSSSIPSSSPIHLVRPSRSTLDSQRKAVSSFWLDIRSRLIRWNRQTWSTAAKIALALIFTASFIGAAVIIIALFDYATNGGYGMGSDGGVDPDSPSGGGDPIGPTSTFRLGNIKPSRGQTHSPLILDADGGTRPYDSNVIGPETIAYNRRTPTHTPEGKLRMAAFCGDGRGGCTNDLGRCFLFKCVCSRGFKGVYCDESCSPSDSSNPLFPSCHPADPTRSDLSLDSAGDHQMFDFHTRSWLTTTKEEEEARQWKYWNGFGHYAAVPQDLGNVLEIGPGAIATTQYLIFPPSSSSSSSSFTSVCSSPPARRIRALTLLDPLLSEHQKKPYSSYASGRFCGSGDAGSDSSFTLALTLEQQRLGQVNYHEQFDTVIVANVTHFLQDAIVGLQSIYGALKRGGVLVFADTDWDGLDAQAEALASLNDPGIRISSYILDHFLDFFTPLYSNSASSLFPRLSPSVSVSLPPPYDRSRFFIGRKLRPEKVLSAPGKKIEKGVAGAAAGGAKKDGKWLGSGVEEGIGKEGEIGFHTMWIAGKNKKGLPNALPKYAMNVIDSVFANHPFAHVHIYSNDVTAAQFTVFTEKKLSLTVHPLDFPDLFAFTPLAGWYSSALSTSNDVNQFNWHVHLSDAFRLAILYRHGGVWFDLDVLFLNPVIKLRNMIARQDGSEPHPNEPHLDSKKKSKLNSALLIMDPGHPFLQFSMELFISRYDPKKYVSVGSSLTTDALELYELISPSLVHHSRAPSTDDVELKSVGDVNVYDPHRFFPFPFNYAPDARFWQRDQLKPKDFPLLSKHNYIFHFFAPILGRQILSGEKEYLDPLSLVGKLMIDNCVVLCDEFNKLNPKKGDYKRHVKDNYKPPGDEAGPILLE